MIKKIIFSIVVLFTYVVHGQQGTASPYSFYGIGEVKFKGTVENRAMGGLTVFSDSIHVNFQNPASYSFLKLTTLNVGGSYLTTKLKTETQEEAAKRVALDYLSVGVPMGKLGASFGLVPFTSVGYRVQNQFVTSSSQVALEKFTGNGGINKFYAGLGYAITPTLRIGANLDYNFGKIESTNSLYIDNIENGSKMYNTSYINGASFTFGLNYTTKLAKKYQLTSNFVFSPQSNLNNENNTKSATIRYNSNGSESIVYETATTILDTKLIIPSKYVFGIGGGINKKWMLGAELTYQQTSVLTNRTPISTNANFENSMKYSFGGYYIPKFNSFSNYFSKIVYRGGIRYENTGLVLNSKSIPDKAVTLGFGLPVLGAFSNINIGLEYGKRGTISTGLVEENYFNVSIGLSLHDKWFVKRLYN